MTDLEVLKSDDRVLDIYRSRLRLKREGNRYRGSCCFHNESTPSLDVFKHDGIWIFNCLGCGAKGNIFQFLEKLDNISFKEAVAVVRNATSDWSKNRESVETHFKPIGQEEGQPKKTYSEEEWQRLENALANSQTGKDWLTSRGISYDTAERLRLGYRQDIGKLAGGQISASVQSGGWIALPTFQHYSSKLVGSDKTSVLVTSIKYRSCQEKAFLAQPGMGADLFGLSQVDCLEPVFLVEGEIDALTLAEIGHTAVSLRNATTALTPQQKDDLLQAECVILAGDNDPAGIKAMERIYAELQERTYWLKWPSGIKDANQMLLETCKGDRELFRRKIEELIAEAKSRPMAGVYSLQEALIKHAEENLVDQPNRFRFPWQNVDSMAILSPGSVIGLVATNTGLGKSTFAIQSTLHGARFHNEIVLNYQAELSLEQVSRIVAAQILRKHRLQLTKEDFQRTAEELRGVKYYIGSDPTLNTIGPVLDLLEKAIRRLSPSVIVLDNLHHLARFENDQVKAVENAMQRIKRLSSAFGLKFIVIGQPRKAEQTMKGKSIHISDVRGSASFGDDSDAVFTIHRDFIKDKDEDKKNEYSPQTKVRLVKVRDKGPGDAEVDLIFLGEMATFAEPTYQEEPTLYS